MKFVKGFDTCILQLQFLCPSHHFCCVLPEIADTGQTPGISDPKCDASL